MLAGGHQVTTRCPLHIILHQSSDGKEHAELTYIPVGRQPVSHSLSLAGVPAAVKEAQHDLTPNDKAITSTPIKLHIWKLHAPEVRLCLSPMCKTRSYAEPESFLATGAHPD